MSRRSCRSFCVTMPVTPLTWAEAVPPTCHMRATASPWSRPATASQKSLMKFERRSSPSVKISNPSSRWRVRRFEDRPVLQLSQVLGPGRGVVARLEECGRAEEAADLIGAVWRGHRGTSWRRAARSAAPRPRAVTASVRGAALGLGHLLDDLGSEVRGREAPEEEREADDGRQLLPRGACAPGGDRVEPRGVSHQGEENAEQHELRRLHVEARRVHRAEARPPPRAGGDPGPAGRGGPCAP